MHYRQQHKLNAADKNVVAEHTMAEERQVMEQSLPNIFVCRQFTQSRELSDKSSRSLLKQPSYLNKLPHVSYGNEYMFSISNGEEAMHLRIRAMATKYVAATVCAIALRPMVGIAQPKATGVAHVATQPDGSFLINNEPTFPIGFTLGPPTGKTTPHGTNGMAFLRQNAFAFQLWSAPPHTWGPQKEAELDALLHEADMQGMHVVISIADLQHISSGDTAHSAELERVIKKYRGDPALLFWKGTDEPQWGGIPSQDMSIFYEAVHRLDPNHPIWVTQAPRGTVADWKPYSPFYDIGAVDIYPISYPPGTHSGIDNKSLSVVGDYTKRIRESLDYQKPAMMILQICWSGVTKPGATLRFPTFFEERYMTYQAIIDGARGLVYFGGNIPVSLNDRDTPYGWNWTFYENVLKPVLDELRPGGPLYPALIAAPSKLPVQADTGEALEFAVREASGYIYILSARREGSTAQTHYSGLPKEIHDGEVLYESPRRVSVVDGGFTDWSGPNEVHVYRFRRP